jgi:hypothetical protein
MGEPSRHTSLRQRLVMTCSRCATLGVNGIVGVESPIDTRGLLVSGLKQAASEPTRIKALQDKLFWQAILLYFDFSQLVHV